MLAGFFVGLVLMILTGFVRDEGRLLDFARWLHYPANQLMLGWDRVFPIDTYVGSILVERFAFVLLWTLLGACIGWVYALVARARRTT